MSNLPAARSELDRIEAFLRTRYHYPHPIFEHVATLREHLEGEVPTEVVEVPQETSTDAISQVEPNPADSGMPEEASEPEAEKSPAPAPRKRGKQR